MAFDRSADGVDIITLGPPVRERSLRPGLRRGGTTRRRAVVALVSLITIAFAVLGDRTERRHEFAGLVARVADARLSAQHANALVRSTREYAMPVLTSSSSESVRTGLGQLIDDAARRAAAEVRAARARVGATTLLPWDGSLRTAKRANLEYLDICAAYFDNVAAGGGSAVPSTDELALALQNATTALRDAAPDRVAAHRVDATLDGLPGSAGVTDAS